MNFYPFNDIEPISPRPMLFITGTDAHSREFSEEAHKRAAEPKELHWIAGAGHVDLYDRVGLISEGQADGVLQPALGPARDNYCRLRRTFGRAPQPTRRPHDHKRYR